jgi:transposase
MQGRHEYQPELFSQIDIETKIPKNHILRKIDRVLDLSFLRGETAKFYAEGIGRPSIDPEIFIRMVLLGYLYDIDSDRQLCEEIGFNLAYCWFCKLSLSDSVPDHSSMTKVRDRLGEETFKRIFLIVVEQCRKAGLVKAERIMADGSVIKANASLYNMEERNPDSAPSSNDYVDTTHSKDGLSNNDLRRGDIRGKKISNETHVSKSDPDCTLAGKASEYKSLAYRTHHMIDADSRVIMDAHVTTGAVSEVSVFCDRIDAVKEIFNIEIGEAIADRGYGSGENLTGLEERGIKSNIPLWSTRTGQGLFRDLEFGFKINEDGSDVSVTCPAGRQMKLRGKDNTHKRLQFEIPRQVCGTCPLADKCLWKGQKRTRSKRFYVSTHHLAWIKTFEKQKTTEFVKKMRERMWKMEGIFAEGKELHGLRRARYRGRWKVQFQVYMISTVQNLKRLANAVFDDFIAILFKFVQGERFANLLEGFFETRPILKQKI